MSNVTITDIGPASGSKPLRRRSKLNVLVRVVGVIVIGGMVIAVFLPSLCRAREPANRIKCSSNLRQIGLAITQYAQSNGGQYPPSLALLLLKQDEILPDVMICPSSNDQRTSAASTAGVVADLEAAEKNTPGHKNCLSYVYAGGRLTVTTALPTTIVAYEPLDNHGAKGTNVLFGDDHVEWIDKDAWPNMAAAAGLVTVPPFKTQP